MQKQIYKSNQNKIIGGVCGGIAEYFEIDPTLVRLFWVLISSMGVGVGAYIICLIIMPERKDSSVFIQEKEYKKEYDGQNDKNRVLIGGVLILLGMGFLLKRYVVWIDFKNLVPFIMILVGAFLILKKEGDN
ncbi:phage shock protein C (PspC) family protein [Alkalithermobacter thermoalcaliphilus JW-YL-7 = DSM 7308]|uniref:Phage shock protein C (PspC) family protein n=1 Tax=Alkalithermobacter thermoalcaliphilus JW-YL-7 = DSM 7308 TaxID=1121328 RepID=A0A150FRN7_CLOPD|nr:phage shock protein C, PspC [[Clostridium] paradoxum JW-YL-7 = DSM 7308]SHK40979.1 phage shock protein C (PspC) family protein [[Clostridium] paradoxum JW-YL-7 = DSM 7308]